MKRSLKQVMAKLLKNEPRTGRKHCRDQFELISRYWQPLAVLDMGNGIVRLMRNDGGYDELNLRALRTEMPIEHYIVVRTLLRLLDEQATVAHHAVEVTKQVLEIQAARKSGGEERAKALKLDAAITDAHLKAEAEKIRQSSRRTKISKREIGLKLSERHGLGSPDVIRRKI